VLAVVKENIDASYLEVIVLLKISF